MKMYAVWRPLSLCAVAAVVWMAGGLSANAAPVADTENTPVVAGHALPGKTVADRDDGRKREDFERRQDHRRDDRGHRRDGRYDKRRDDRRDYDRRDHRGPGPRHDDRRPDHMRTL